MLQYCNKPNLYRIALLGAARSGKDTIGKYLYDNYGYNRYAFGDELKRHYHEIFGEADHKPRQGYQAFGQAMRTVEPDIWIRRMFDSINEMQPDKIVVTDCRQPNEYERLVREGFVMVRILCDEVTRIERMRLAGDVFTDEDLQHETEEALNDFPSHIVVFNTGTKEELFLDFERRLRLFFDN